MTSLVAVLEDGITHGQQALRREYQRQSSAKEAATGVGSLKGSILYVLFSLDLREMIAGAGETGCGEEV